MAKSSSILLVAVALLGWGYAPLGAAEKAAHVPRVPGFERFFAGDDADHVTGGEILIGELNCLACHRGSLPSKSAVEAKKAPILDDLGQRVRPQWIQEFLAAPHQVKPGTTMPDLLASLPEGERTDAVLALTHLLASTGTTTDSHPDQAAANRGKTKFQRVGCLACHNSSDDGVGDLPTSIALPDLSRKYTASGLANFLKDPLKARPSGRMPAFGLKDEDYRDIAQHFIRDAKLKPNVKFSVYYGNWEKLPNFSELKPEKTGECAGFDLTVAGRENNFAVRFETNLQFHAPSQQQFYLGSDDGSRLIIGGHVICENDGVHAHSEVKGRHSFDVGWQPVVVEYFQGGGEWTLDVDIEGNGLKRHPLAADVRLTTGPESPKEDPSRVQIDPQLVAKGQELFASLGCAACHQLKLNGKTLASTLKAPKWEQLKPIGGCLADAPARGRPHFGLSAAQKRAIASVPSAPARELTEKDQIHRTLATLNCYACHQRGEIGGVEEARNASFDSTQKEMGDEGRIPPALTGVGDKLRDEWLKQVLEQGANDRQNYMQTKMPKFGGRNIGHLVAAFIAADRQPESAPKPEFKEPDYRVKAVGRHLVGGKALSCIKCHDFGQFPAQGIRAISLTSMSRRLRGDWFYRYVSNPQEFRPGTRMPAAWPFGQTTIRDVLDGNVDQQIIAVWKYLEDGDKAAIPLGLVREPIELVAAETPILYRNFIEGAGSRAIGVGYPEHLNLAWDANDMRLAIIWHGAFMDASRHWTGRGVGYEHPLGDDVLQFPTGAPIAVLKTPGDAWPNNMAREQGFRFRGYQLDGKQRPEFRYGVGAIEVTDAFEPREVSTEKYPHLARTLTFRGSANDEPWHFRAVSANQIETVSPGVFRIDGVWTITVSGSRDPIVRDAGGRKELLLPLGLKGEETVRLEYAW